MLIDVQDSTRGIALNVCFYAIVLLALVGAVPWKTLGAARLSRALRWLMLPVLGFAIAYESIMPSRMNIRIDLLLLAPAYVLTIVTSLVRWLAKGDA
jgi:hypothetical protein